MFSVKWLPYKTKGKQAYVMVNVNFLHSTSATIDLQMSQFETG
jgi:hypothetical protein